MRQHSNLAKDTAEKVIPVLQHDPGRAEDLDTADGWRYACMSRPWIKEKPVEEKGKDT